MLTEGKWTIKYGSNSKHTLKVTGISIVKLKYGFSTKNATTIGEATNWPLIGNQNYIWIHFKFDQVFTFDFLKIIRSSK